MASTLEGKQALAASTPTRPPVSTPLRSPAVIDYAILDSNDDEMEDAPDSLESKSEADPSTIDAMETEAPQQNLDTT